MALATAQRAQIRLYLGWSARFHQTDSRLEQAMNALDAGQTSDPDTFALVTNAVGATPPGILALLADIDARITSALTNVKALKVGAIDLPGPLEIGMLRSLGREYAGRLAALLGVEVRHDVFAGRGPRSYATSRGLLPGAGGSNYPPQG